MNPLPPQKSPLGKTIRPLSTADVEILRRDEQAASLLMSARNAHRKGQREEAKNFIRQLLVLKPDDAGAVEIWGDLLLEEGETAQALALYERALASHPENALFEERAAICRLDLAEIEADKHGKTTLLNEGDNGKIFERTPHKAVSLSIFLPGGGQFYNEEPEKGALFLGAGLISVIGWFYPLWTQMSRWSGSADALNLGKALGAMPPIWSAIFWLCLLVWIGVYLGSLVDAGREAARFNHERRRLIGLEN